MRMTGKRRVVRAVAITVLTALGMVATGASAETVMITGANSGIGLEFAKQYAAKGWTVIVTHRRKEDPPTLTDLVAKYPGKIRIERLDVTSESEAGALAASMKSTPIDVLINNAGVYNDRSKCKGTMSPVPATGARRPSAR